VVVGKPVEDEDEVVPPSIKGDEPLNKALDLLKVKNG
jgi:hypothetical protein